MARQASINSSMNIHNNQDLTVKYSNAHNVLQNSSTLNKFQKKIAPVIIFCQKFLCLPASLIMFAFCCCFSQKKECSGSDKFHYLLSFCSNQHITLVSTCIIIFSLPTLTLSRGLTETEDHFITLYNEKFSHASSFFKH